ncbi:MAG: AI-2E family transporter, partial [Christensenellales bacterium]
MEKIEHPSKNENEKINENEVNENITITNDTHKNEQPTKFISKKSIVISIFLAVLFGIIIANIAGGYIGELITGLISTFTAFASALIIIFILKHLMNFIENKLLKHFFVGLSNEKKIKRTISIIIAFILLILTIFLCMSLIVPKIIDIVTELVNNRESYIYQIKSQLTDFITSLIDTKADDTVNSIMVSISTYLEDTFNNFLPQLLAISTSTIMTMGQICMGGVLAFLYLYNRESINKFFAGLMKSKCKPSTVENTYKIMQHSDRVLLDYIVAKIIEAIVITVVIGIGLSIIGVKYAFELALIIGILNVIPYIGFIIALVPTTLITIIYGSIDLAIQALIVTAVIYIILTTFITPVIVGKKIKINMLLMFSAMILGGGMFGIIGMAVAPPIACIGAEIFKQKMKINQSNINTNINENQNISINGKQNENNSANASENESKIESKNQNLSKNQNSTDTNKQIEKNAKTDNASNVTKRHKKNNLDDTNNNNNNENVIINKEKISSTQTKKRNSKNLKTKNSFI